MMANKVQHSALGGTIHAHHPYRWVKDNEVDRLNIVPSSEDVNKLALQLDTGKEYRLVSASPVVWGDALSEVESDVSSLQDNKVDKVEGKQLSDENYTLTEKQKLSGIESEAQVNTVNSVNTKVGDVTLSTTDVGEGDNLYYTDARARDAISASGSLDYDPLTGVVSYTERTAEEIKTGYESNLNTNAFTDAEQSKLAGIEDNATANSTDAQLRDRTTHTGEQPISTVTGLQGALDTKANSADLSAVATTGSYNDLLNKPDLSVLEEVLVFAALSEFPETGESEKVYISEDTGYMYRWSGSEYIQLTDQTAIWGNISGNLSAQADLLSELNAKVDKVEGKQLSDENYTLVEKDKLDGIEAGAQVNVATNLSLGTRTATVVPVNSSTGDNVSLPSSTTTLAGVMSSADKGKLDGIPSDAIEEAPQDGNTYVRRNGAWQRLTWGTE